MQSSRDESKEPWRDWVAKAFKFTEDTVYIALGVLLAACAIGFLIVSAADFAKSIMAGDLSGHVVTLLARLLMVLLIVELLYTVQVSFSAGTILPEPFLLIGLIAAIRRVFVLTAEFSKVGGERAIEFEHFIVELGVLTILILVIAASILLLRKSNTYGRQQINGS